MIPPRLSHKETAKRQKPSSHWKPLTQPLYPTTCPASGRRAPDQCQEKPSVSQRLSILFSAKHIPVHRSSQICTYIQCLQTRWMMPLFPKVSGPNPLSAPATSQRIISLQTDTAPSRQPPATTRPRRAVLRRAVRATLRDCKSHPPLCCSQLSKDLPSLRAAARVLYRFVSPALSRQVRRPPMAGDPFPSVPAPAPGCPSMPQSRILSPG